MNIGRERRFPQNVYNEPNVCIQETHTRKYVSGKFSNEKSAYARSKVRSTFPNNKNTDRNKIIGWTHSGAKLNCNVLLSGCGRSSLIVRVVLARSSCLLLLILMENGPVCVCVFIIWAGRTVQMRPFSANANKFSAPCFM